ncbi:putative Nucleolar pre-ribosomal-associated protein 1 [Paratrimastix pyriformis]|uniref:Nucleolar pre-ribosomal-associated protein 1 n=1 Tax=Paratrimastix pyriformis TaxID=342808 RepID=A0ABQ8UR54_9EUKA|nr:putative Nucleolar pre-ribosomal-associated protein 1 [Paratrimastix pyriformis]
MGRIRTFSFLRSQAGVQAAVGAGAAFPAALCMALPVAPAGRARRRGRTGALTILDFALMLHPARDPRISAAICHSLPSRNPLLVRSPQNRPCPVLTPATPFCRPTTTRSYLSRYPPITDVRAAPGFLDQCAHIARLLAVTPPAAALPAPTAPAAALAEDGAEGAAPVVDLLPCLPRATLSKGCQHQDPAVRRAVLTAMFRLLRACEAHPCSAPQPTGPAAAPHPFSGPLRRSLPELQVLLAATKCDAPQTAPGPTDGSAEVPAAVVVKEKQKTTGGDTGVQEWGLAVAAVLVRMCPEVRTPSPSSPSGTGAPHRVPCCDFHLVCSHHPPPSSRPNHPRALLMTPPRGGRLAATSLAAAASSPFALTATPATLRLLALHLLADSPLARGDPSRWIPLQATLSVHVSHSPLADRLAAAVARRLAGRILTATGLVDGCPEEAQIWIDSIGAMQLLREPVTPALRLFPAWSPAQPAAAPTARCLRRYPPGALLDAAFRSLLNGRLLSALLPQLQAAWAGRGPALPEGATEADAEALAGELAMWVAVCARRVGILYGRERVVCTLAKDALSFAAAQAESATASTTPGTTKRPRSSNSTTSSSSATPSPSISTPATPLRRPPLPSPPTPRAFCPPATPRLAGLAAAEPRLSPATTTSLECTALPRAVLTLLCAEYGIETDGAAEAAALVRPVVLRALGAGHALCAEVPLGAPAAGQQGSESLLEWDELAGPLLDAHLHPNPRPRPSSLAHLRAHPDAAKRTRRWVGALPIPALRSATPSAAEPVAPAHPAPGPTAAKAIRGLVALVQRPQQDGCGLAEGPPAPPHAPGRPPCLALGPDAHPGGGPLRTQLLALQAGLLRVASRLASRRVRLLTTGRPADAQAPQLGGGLAEVARDVAASAPRAEAGAARPLEEKKDEEADEDEEQMPWAGLREDALVRFVGLLAARALQGQQEGTAAFLDALLGLLQPLLAEGRRPGSAASALVAALTGRILGHLEAALAQCATGTPVQGLTSVLATLAPSFTFERLGRLLAHIVRTHTAETAPAYLDCLAPALLAAPLALPVPPAGADPMETVRGWLGADSEALRRLAAWGPDALAGLLRPFFTSGPSVVTAGPASELATALATQSPKPTLLACLWAIQPSMGLEAPTASLAEPLSLADPRWLSLHALLAVAAPSGPSRALDAVRAVLRQSAPGHTPHFWLGDRPAPAAAHPEWLSGLSALAGRLLAGEDASDDTLCLPAVLAAHPSTTAAPPVALASWDALGAYLLSNPAPGPSMVKGLLALSKGWSGADDLETPLMRGVLAAWLATECSGGAAEPERGLTVAVRALGLWAEAALREATAGVDGHRIAARRLGRPAGEDEKDEGAAAPMALESQPAAATAADPEQRAQRPRHTEAIDRLALGARALALWIGRWAESQLAGPPAATSPSAAGPTRHLRRLLRALARMSSGMLTALGLPPAAPQCALLQGPLAWCCQTLLRWVARRAGPECVAEVVQGHFAGLVADCGCLPGEGAPAPVPLLLGAASALTLQGTRLGRALAGLTDPKDPAPAPLVAALSWLDLFLVTLGAPLLSLYLANPAPAPAPEGCPPPTAPPAGPSAVRLQALNVLGRAILRGYDAHAGAEQRARLGLVQALERHLGCALRAAAGADTRQSFSLERLGFSWGARVPLRVLAEAAAPGAGPAVIAEWAGWALTDSTPERLLDGAVLGATCEHFPLVSHPALVIAATGPSNAAAAAAAAAQIHPAHSPATLLRRAALGLDEQQGPDWVVQALGDPAFLAHRCTDVGSEGRLAELYDPFFVVPMLAHRLTGSLAAPVAGVWAKQHLISILLCALAAPDDALRASATRGLAVLWQTLARPVREDLPHNEWPSLSPSPPPHRGMMQPVLEYLRAQAILDENYERLVAAAEPPPKEAEPEEDPETNPVALQRRLRLQKKAAYRRVLAQRQLKQAHRDALTEVLEGARAPTPDQQQVGLLLEVMRNSIIVEPEEGAPTTSTSGTGAAEAANPRVPAFVAQFMAQAVPLACRPEHTLYMPVMKFALRASSVSTRTVPLNAHLLADVGAHAHQVQPWALRALSGSLLGVEEHRQFLREHLYEMALTSVRTPTASPATRRAALQLLLSAARIPSAALDLVTRLALIPWVESVLLSLPPPPAILTPEQAATLEGLADLLGALVVALLGLGGHTVPLPGAGCVTPAPPSSSEVTPAEAAEEVAEAGSITPAAASAPAPRVREAPCKALADCEAALATMGRWAVGGARTDSEDEPEWILRWRAVRDVIRWHRATCKVH